LLKEWLDPAYLRLVELVSSPTRPDQHVEGLRILAHLCRRALQPPLPLQHMRQVAECEFSGIAMLCLGEEEARYGKWPYSRETTLKWFVLLEALTLIRRFRRGGKTVIQIRLGKREPLNQAQLLANLDNYAIQYTNRKTVELLLRAKADLQRYGIPSSGLEESDLLDQEVLQRVQQHLVAKLQESGVSRAASRKVALWLTSGPLAQIATDYLQAVRPATTTTGKALPSPHGHAAPAHLARGSQFDFQQGDSLAQSQLSAGRFLSNEQAAREWSAGERAHPLPFSDDEKSDVAGEGKDCHLRIVQGDSLGQEPARTRRHGVVQGGGMTQASAQSETVLAMKASANHFPVPQGDFEPQQTPKKALSRPMEGAPGGPNRLTRDLLPTGQGDFKQVDLPATMTGAPAESPCRASRATSAGAVSNSNAISSLKDPLRECEFEFETSAEHHIPESPSLSGDRRAEATYLWRKLYSEEQRCAPGGKQLIGGLLNKLNERPDLVRLSMVNVLLQRVFPDRHGPPDGCGAKWFYRSYARYLSGELTPSPQISSWAQSPYSYEQIERALRAEYAYQQADVFCKPQRPFASCIVEHRLRESVPLETGGEARQEHQFTEQAGAPSAGEGGQAAQSSLEQEDPIPTEDACTPIQRHQASAAIQQDSVVVASAATQPPHEGHKHKVVVVQDPQTGWTSLEGVLWWREQITRTSLASTWRLEVLPTIYDRYVLVVTPDDDEAAAWFWSSGRQVRLALEQWRAARVQI
jgi:hypothetical protein